VDTGVLDFTSDDPALLVHPGTVTITAENAVMLSGSFGMNPHIPVINASAIGTLVDAGPVTITGKTVDLSNGTIVASMNEGTFASPGNGGTIQILGNKVNLSQFTLTSDNGGFTGSTGKGGSILVQGADHPSPGNIHPSANNIQMTNSSVNATSVTGGGAGNITFYTEALTLNNTQVAANSFSDGPGGSIAVQGAQTVTLQSNSLMDASAVVSRGPIGTAGSIFLETQQLTMQGGSSLRAADRPTSQGNAGSIIVQGTNGPAQSILIDGSGTGIFTDAEGNGVGGNISLFANSVTLQNSGTLSAATSGTASSATGGSIQVDANHLQINSSATITANSTGAADAGNINLTASNSFTMQNSSITTQANDAGGGTIKITTDPSGTVQLINSTISASVLNGNGGGGSVNIDPQFVILLNSNILAKAVQGPGGNIFITTNLLLQDGSSVISASSQFGQNGTITIQSPNAPISGKIQPLGNTLLAATSLLNQRCAALAGGEFSSFTVAGRDNLPVEPGTWLASPLAMGPVGSNIGTVTEGSEQATVIHPEHENTILSLRQIAPAGFLTQAFAVNGSAGCTS
jgi:large exoprotein involved in heme utilization and adhesion